MANFTHFFIAGISLLKGLFSHMPSSPFLWIAGGLYALLGVLFGMLLFSHPVKDRNA
jgi:hypothetical protein